MNVPARSPCRIRGFSLVLALPVLSLSGLLQAQGPAIVLEEVLPRTHPRGGGTQISVLVESPREDWLLTLALVRNSTSQTHGAPVWNHEEGASTLSFSRSPLNNDVST